MVSALRIEGKPCRNLSGLNQNLTGLAQRYCYIGSSPCARAFSLLLSYVVRLPLPLLKIAAMSGLTLTRQMLVLLHAQATRCVHLGPMGARRGLMASRARKAVRGYALSLAPHHRVQGQGLCQACHAETKVLQCRQ